MALPDCILVTGARAPVALHLTRLLTAAGHRVVLADSLRGPLAGYSRLHGGCHLLPSPRFEPQACALALQRLIAQEGIGLVLPTCEEIFHLADLWQNTGMPCPLLAPGFAALMRAHHKGWFIADCAAAGLAVPETTILTDRAALAPFVPQARGMVFKPAWSRFADQVLIRPGPRHVAALRPTPQMPWIAQRFVSGDEICVYAVACEGRLTALSPYRALWRAGAGAAIAFEQVQDPGVEDFVTRYIAATGWSGQISFDLMRLANGQVLPLECNPRATSGLHFFDEGPRFAAALAGKGLLLRASPQSPMGSRLAVRLNRLASLRPAGPQEAAIRDIHDWPGDSLSGLTQLRGLWPIARQALWLRKSLIAASTHDIEWNGREDQSSM